MKEEKKIKRKASKLKKLPSHHGMILQGPNQKLQQSMTTVQDEEEEELQLAMALSLSEEEATKDVSINRHYYNKVM